MESIKRPYIFWKHEIVLDCYLFSCHQCWSCAYKDVLYWALFFVCIISELTFIIEFLLEWSLHDWSELCQRIYERSDIEIEYQTLKKALIKYDWILRENIENMVKYWLDEIHWYFVFLVFIYTTYSIKQFKNVCKLCLIYCMQLIFYLLPLPIEGKEFILENIILILNFGKVV